MAHRAAELSRAPLPVADLITLDRTASTSLALQLVGQLRSAILEGRVAPGARLPGSRRLADALNISRTTVLEASEQLRLEGYLCTRPGGGTYVAAQLTAQTTPAAEAATPPRRPRLSARGLRLSTTTLAARHRQASPLPFQPGLPDSASFPHAAWLRAAREARRDLSPEALGYQPVAGFMPLRDAIARYLRAARGVAVEPEQIIVTSGTQQSLALIALTLLDPDERVGLENPGYASGRDALIGLGAVPVPIVVDSDGADPSALERDSAPPRLVVLTPSHQSPTGALLSLERRLRWLDWAERTDAYIVEDDYDSEFRYDAHPVPAMHGLTPAARAHVLYAGTYSKTLAPGLRLGYLIVPPELIAPIEAARGAIDRAAPTLSQATLARFLDSGRYVRHLAAQRRRYQERRAALLTALADTLPSEATVLPSAAGLQITIRLPASIDDVALATRLHAEGFGPAPLSKTALEGAWHGLIIGFASADVGTLQRGAVVLGNHLRAALSP